MMDNQNQVQNEYGADQIQILEGLEAVRKCLDYFTQHSKGEEELSCCKNS